MHVSGAAHEAEAPEKLVEVDAGTMVQVCGLLTCFAAIKIETGAGRLLCACLLVGLQSC